MPSYQSDEQLSLRAREVVNGLIEGFKPGAEDGDLLGPALTLLGNLDGEIPLILDAVMQRGEWYAQVFAALAFYKGVEAFPHIASQHQDILRRSERIVMSALDVIASSDTHHNVCELMGRIGVVPSCTVPRLERLMHSDDLTSAYAASAMCWLTGDNRDVATQELALRAQAKLGMLLRSEVPEAVLIAAPPLLLLGYQFDVALSVLQQTLPLVPWHKRCGVIRHLNMLGPKAAVMQPMLEELLENDEIPSFHRAKAAAAIGSVSSGNPRTLDSLSSYLNSGDHHLLIGAADGIRMHGGVRKTDILQIARQLKSDDRELRQAALVSLYRFGQEAKPALPQLLEHLSKEEDGANCKTLSEAIAAVGVDAIDPLIDEAKRLNMRTYPMITQTLKEIGDHAVIPVTQRLVAHENEQIRFMGLQILNSMRSKAAPAIPAMIEILRETQNLDIAYMSLATISVCGPAAEQAVEAIIQTIVTWDNEDIFFVASRTLQQIGEKAEIALKSVEPDLSGDALERVQFALALCRRRSDDRYRHLQAIDSDDLLRYFALVGQVLRELGKCGWRRIAEVIRPYVTFKRANQVQLGTSANSVRDNVTKLADKLGIEQLTTHGRNKGGQLSLEGERLLNEATDYIRGKYGHDAVPDIVFDR